MNVQTSPSKRLKQIPNKQRLSSYYEPFIFKFKNFFCFFTSILCLSFLVLFFLFSLLQFSSLLGNQAFAAESESSTKSSTVELKKFIGFPIFYFTPETGTALGGLGIWNFWPVSLGKTSQVVSYISLTQNNQKMITISPRFYFQGGDQELSASFFTSYYPYRYYFTEKEQLLSEKYTEENLLFHFGFSQRIFSHWFLKALLGKDERKIIDLDQSI